MHTTRQTATISPTEMIQEVARTYSASRYVRMPRAALHQSGGAVAPIDRSTSVNEVCELIRAAGPLTVRDVAGGLGVPEREASTCVQRMIAQDLLQQDEWERYRVWGECT